MQEAENMSIQPINTNLVPAVNPTVEHLKPVSVPTVEMQSMIPLVKPTEKGEVTKQSDEKDQKNSAEDQGSSDIMDTLFQDTELKISVSKEGQTFVKIIDTKTQEVVNEIPPEKLAKILSELRRVSGMLFNRKA